MGRFEFNALKLKGAYIIRPTSHTDDRGIFTRIFCANEFRSIGLERPFVQVNHSMTSQKGCVRGMHYQKPPRADVRLVKCISGAVYDVIVDLRQDSPTFLHWHSERLDPLNMLMIFVPEGFAHGFQTLEPKSELLYFHVQPYSPEYEEGIRHDDPALSIEWPLEASSISSRDRNHPLIGSCFKGVKL